MSHISNSDVLLQYAIKTWWAVHSAPPDPQQGVWLEEPAELESVARACVALHGQLQREDRSPPDPVLAEAMVVLMRAVHLVQAVEMLDRALTASSGGIPEVEAVRADTESAKAASVGAARAALDAAMKQVSPLLFEARVAKIVVTMGIPWGEAVARLRSG